MVLYNRDKDMRVYSDHFPNRKKPVLVFQHGNLASALGYFNNDEAADIFMKFLAEMVGAKDEEEDKCLR